MTMTPVRYLTSRYALLSWAAGRASLVGTGVLVPSGCDLAALLSAFATRPRALDEPIAELATLAPELRDVVLNDLVRSGVLVPEASEEAPARTHWDVLAWAYHRVSRQPHRASTMASDDGPHRPPRLIKLARPDPAPAQMRGVFELLAARRSTRTWQRTPMTLDTLACFLGSCAGDRQALRSALPDPEQAPALGEMGRNDDSERSRPYPSGGAAYTLVIYPVIAQRAVDGLPGGVYRYAADVHGLEPVCEDAAEAGRLLAVLGHAADAPPPPVGLIVTSRHARQSQRYGAMAYSLVLKEVGALMQTAYLVGAALGLGVCALGGGTPARRFDAVRRSDDTDEPVVGELIVGPS